MTSLTASKIRIRKFESAREAVTYAEGHVVPDISALQAERDQIQSRLGEINIDPKGGGFRRTKNAAINRAVKYRLNYRM